MWRGPRLRLIRTRAWRVSPAHTEARRTARRLAINRFAEVTACRAGGTTGSNGGFDSTPHSTKDGGRCPIRRRQSQGCCKVSAIECQETSASARADSAVLGLPTSTESNSCSIGRTSASSRSAVAANAPAHPKRPADRPECSPPREGERGEPRSDLWSALEPRLEADLNASDIGLMPNHNKLRWQYVVQWSLAQLKDQRRVENPRRGVWG